MLQQKSKYTRLPYKILSQNLVSKFLLDEGKEFYRARNKFYTLNGAEDLYRNFSELWYPDAKYLNKLGRLNRVGQQVMYASLDALTPIHEIRSANDSQFALMKYKIKNGQQLKLATIAFYSHDVLAKSLGKNVNWTKKGLENWKIINNFLCSEFTRKVTDGQEYVYKSTNVLLKFADLPDSDGFLYPSIERSGGYNIAIKPRAADEKVDFIGLAYFKNNYYDKQQLVRNDFMCYRKWSNCIDKGKIVYSPVSKCPISFLNLVDGELIDDVYHEQDVVPTERFSNKRVTIQKKRGKSKRKNKK